MFKYAALATTAMLAATPALAQIASPPPGVVELEGRLEAYDHPTRMMTVMGMQVEVLNTTTMSSPMLASTTISGSKVRGSPGAARPGSLAARQS